MASGKTIDDWKDVPSEDWKDVAPGAPPSLVPGTPNSSFAGRVASSIGSSLNPINAISGAARLLTDPQHGFVPREKESASQGLAKFKQEAPEFIGQLLAVPAGGLAMKGISSPMARGGERLYQSALKPPPVTSGSLADVKNLVRTGLEERVPVTEGGYQKLGGKIEGVNREIGGILAGSNKQISPTSVAGRIEQIRPNFQEQVNPESDVNALSGVKGEYLRKHTVEAPFTKVAPGMEEESGRLIPVGKGSTPMPQDYPIQEAQREKIGTYRQLRGKYGELKGAEVEGQKALGRGLKEDIAAAEPKIALQNARESRLLRLEEPLQRAVKREGNRMVVPIGDTTVSLARKIVDNPALKSYSAIGLNELGQRLLRFAAGATMARPLLTIPESSYRRQ